MTLVIMPDGPKVRSLWTIFNVANVPDARKALGIRECRSKDNPAKCIADWTREDATALDPIGIGRWARELGLDAVVWTALPPKYNCTDGRTPTVEEAVSYLAGLKGEAKRLAEEYVRRAPFQVDTPYRRRFEADLGWTPILQAQYGSSK